ncbi:uncharacterized protein THITE_2107960 [Thermothielavioides terrestris NRRL 8126]|uniref:Uncharacterized protein n=1 Tax=Thermothielavioides terrestris (strain ATCC 38088 / NRRL 8126) TaxID=578455 RepID=G2QWT1_THETT|nr:uncharacterized protein THITE_2107960 [Thermothielavioides terrestris NRRL 8126]AEO63095.1 hypothetical protein THITE_2107960 [Thermothielavioides terrestris NRRL 8126]
MACNELDRGHPGLAGILLANVGIFLGLRASSWPTRASSWVRGHPGQRVGIFLGSQASSACQFTSI